MKRDHTPSTQQLNSVNCQQKISKISFQKILLSSYYWLNLANISRRPFIKDIRSQGVAQCGQGREVLQMRTFLTFCCKSFRFFKNFLCSRTDKEVGGFKVVRQGINFSLFCADVFLNGPRFNYTVHTIKIIKYESQNKNLL